MRMTAAPRGVRGAQSRRLGRAFRKYAHPLDEATLEKVRGLGDPTSMLDVREVYLPLTRLLSRYFLHTSELHQSTNEFSRCQWSARRS